jgi:hypothetical protein
MALRFVNTIVVVNTQQGHWAAIREENCTSFEDTYALAAVNERE